MVFLWQSDGLARPSVVLPLHAGLFISYCFSTTLLISGLSIKTVHPFDPMIKQQAQPGVLVPFEVVISLVKVEANKTKGK